MGKKGTIYIVIAIIALAILMLLQYNKAKELNWFPSYVTQHKIPYGTYVLNEVMKNNFKDKTQHVNVPPFEFLTAHNEIKGTYFFVNEKVEFGESELDALLKWTSEGNTLFIASKNYEKKLLDTLSLETANMYAEFGEEQKQLHHLVHPQLKSDKGYSFDKENYATFFSKVDSTKTTVLGLVDYFSEDGTSQKENYNAIKLAYGDGKIILSAFPKAFTNYFILKDNNKNYTAGLLSYIDDSETIYIDNHYKAGKAFYTSPMHIFLNTKEFKWAYYLALIGALIYVVFEGKRKQRAIPVVHPLKNQTLAFTRTIADMYFEKGEQKPITEHKIAYFLEYIRSQFYMNTLKRDDDFYRNLAARSNHSKEEIKTLFNLIDQLKGNEGVTDIELKRLNTLIEKFKVKAHGK